jgi:hypothetical protein
MELYYRPFKYPTNIVQFNVMLGGTDFPLIRLESPDDDYPLRISDSDRFEIIGQIYCMFDEGQKEIFKGLIESGLVKLKSMNK